MRDQKMQSLIVVVVFMILCQHVLVSETLAVATSVGLKGDPENGGGRESNPISTAGRTLGNGSSSDNAVNYASVGGVDDEPEMDLSSIQTLLHSLRMLIASRDIRHVMPRPPSVNATCYDQTIKFLDSLLGAPPTNTSGEAKTPNWALQMFDAFGKPGSGILEGSMQWVGAYQECLDVHAYIPKGTQFGSRVVQEESEFDTQYCRVEILLDRAMWERSSYASKMNKFWKSSHSPDLVLNWGMCLPQSCTNQDIEHLLNQGILSKLNMKVQYATCYQEASTIHEDNGALAVIILLSLFGVIVISLTIVETILHYTRGRGQKHDGGKLAQQSKHTKDASSTPMLKDGTDLTITINPPAETEQTVCNGTSSPTKTIQNGDVEKTHCNGVVKNGKELNPQSNHNHHHNNVSTNNEVKEINKDNDVNGVQKSNGTTDTNQYQINMGCDESGETELCNLDVEKELPASVNGNAVREKGGKRKAEKAESKEINSKAAQMIKAFSMRANLIRLLKTSSTHRPGVIRCLDGMRVVSMLWIVLGHTYTFGAVMDNGNLLFGNTVEVARTTAKVSFFLVTGATFAVDTFFMMSGMLVTMLTLKQLKKMRPSCGFWGLFYFHRLWRLTPVYMVVLMFCITMYDHTVSGPLKSMPLKEYDDCQSKWWTHLLYINNLYEPQQKCMTWTWYLAVDMQLFAIAPIIIYVIHRSVRVGVLTMAFLIITGMLAAFISQYTYFGQFVLMDQVFSDYWQHVYIVPWTRIGAFVIGMCTGVAILNEDKMPQISKLTAGFIWVVISAVAFIFIFIPHNQWKEGSNLWAQTWQALYEALSRPIWALCAAMVVYLCHTGRGGVANNILGWPGFQPFSRITYAVYLIHPVVITFFVYSRNTPVFLQDTTIMYQYIGNVVLSYIFGTILCIMFESPMMALERILLR